MIGNLASGFDLPNLMPTRHRINLQHNKLADDNVVAWLSGNELVSINKVALYVGPGQYLDG